MDLKTHKKSISPINRQSTLCFLIKDTQILLAMKKRGFGQGRWNGVGGKPNPGEDILNTAIRETQEEIGVLAKNLKHLGTLDFYFKDNPDWNQQVFTYITYEWEGEPVETEEMRPQWYDQNNLPFNLMWPDDPLWLPLVLQNKEVVAEFLFGENDSILDYQVEISGCRLAPINGKV